MTWKFGQALDGNIAVMGEIDVAQNREFTIAIALGDGQPCGAIEMMQALSTPYAAAPRAVYRAVACGR